MSAGAAGHGGAGGESRRARRSILGAYDRLEEIFDAVRPELEPRPVGTVMSVGGGVAQVEGLRGARSEELLFFESGARGLALDVGREQVGVVLLNDFDGLVAGEGCWRADEMLRVPVGRALLGRTVDPLGRPLDRSSVPNYDTKYAVERPAPAILDRVSVTRPLQTGVKVVDALVPIGRGQRELILGDRQTGKTSLAIDTILAQADSGVICIYCAVGQRASEVAKNIGELRARGALDYTVVVVAEAEDLPGLQFVAPYAATSMGEWFMERGHDVLIVYDDLTRHAWAYRELSLLLRRPPGREAYPGDIFYAHARLLERATQLSEALGGGSMTALPIVETEAQNLAAYIPTNLISITDGQVYLSPEHFRKGLLPAVDVGLSVSRVGGKAQLAAYRHATAALRLGYAQFEELEVFSRFGTRLDADSRVRLERGRRVRALLKQQRFSPVDAAAQVVLLVALAEGCLDPAELEELSDIEERLYVEVQRDMSALVEKVRAGRELDADDVATICEHCSALVAANACGPVS